MLRLRDVERMFLIADARFWVKAVSRVVPFLRDKPLTQRVRRALPDFRVEGKTVDQICIDLRMMRLSSTSVPCSSFRRKSLDMLSTHSVIRWGPTALTKDEKVRSTVDVPEPMKAP